jgi:hypothetical protein
VHRSPAPQDAAEATEHESPTSAAPDAAANNDVTAMITMAAASRCRRVVVVDMIDG